jgi:hypothetical protein
MATAVHPRSVGYPTAPARSRLDGGTLRTITLTSLAVVIGALMISALMALSILLTSPAPWWDMAPMAQPMPQPSAAAGLDL